MNFIRAQYIPAKSKNLMLPLILILFMGILLRNAWVCDDAYITFRTIDNFVNGYGLTWNTTERVQAYTHPLWMFLLSLFYLITHEAYYTSVFISIIITIATIFILIYKISNSTSSALLGATILLLSKAFVDYSTSGLENCLTNLVLILFMWIYLGNPMGLKQLLMLSLLFSLGVLNRLDLVIMFAPPLLYYFVKIRSSKAFLVLITGLTPIIAWEFFSLLYYGFLFPNTAYTKLNTGISTSQLIIQGALYFGDSFLMDHLTLPLIITGILLPVFTKEKKALAVSYGITLYLTYLVKIGGDFMSGRFLTAPLLASVVLVSNSPIVYRLRKSVYSAAFLAVLAIGLSSPYPPILSTPLYSADREKYINQYGIADERGYYYKTTGLLRGANEKQIMNHPWAKEGQEIAAKKMDVVTHFNVGMLGFYAGAMVHIVDTFALTDPLLARLPAEPKWRIGHFKRVIPDGYIETLKSGQNLIKDENIAAYYDKLYLITRGKIFSVNRIKEIWHMNTGKYNRLINP